MHQQSTIHNANMWYHFALYVFVWVQMLLDHVSAISIPKPSLSLDSSGTKSLNASYSLISNLTSLGAIDPAFGFVPIFYGVKLRPVPCLLNSVNAALELALEDYEGPMFQTVFRLDAYPQVEIAVIPDEEGGSVPRKYVVWGLNIGIHLMITNLNFQAAAFILSYRGHGVACIEYKVTGAPGFKSTNIANATEGGNRTISLSELTNWLPQASTSAHSTSVDPINDPRLEVSFQLTGSVVTVYEVFLMALDMLREIAPFKRTARLGDGATLITAANLVVSTRQTDPPRTAQNPPYFQVQWLMKALAQTPTYMLEQANFREVDMVLSVNEVKVGEISAQRPRNGNGLSPASGDLSTS